MKKLNTLYKELSIPRKEISKERQKLYWALTGELEKFFQGLQPTSPEEEIINKINDFGIFCAKNIEIADKIMGHG